MTAEFIFPIRIYYEDTDVLGMVYHANYIKYMERARSEWLRELGFTYEVAQQAGVSFVVHSLQVKYLQPAHFEDLLAIVSRPREINKASIVFDQVVRAAANPEIVYCIGQVTIVCVNTSQRPCAMPEFLIARFNSGN
jgi:acyl-CoA thioester hydrolase